jgi:endoglycosylceramidase
MLARPFVFAALGACLCATTACGSSNSGGSGGGASATCTLQAPVLSSSRLAAQGTKLVDALGRTVFLRGVDAGGRSKFAPYVPFDFASGQYASALNAYMSRAQSWGIDAMRVPFTWAALEPTEGTYDQAWLSMYAQLLASAWSHGIYTVIDFHQDVYSEVYCGDGFPSWTVANPPAPHHDCPNWELEYFDDSDVQAAFDAFWNNTTGLYPKYLAAWDTMIARFKDMPGVIGFEIINEPGPGAAGANFESATLTPFYTKVATHMRAEAPDDLFFVDAPGVDGVLVSTTLANPGVPGIVFAPHYYPVTSPNAAQVASDLGVWLKVGNSWNVPVFLGEFGASNTNATGEAYIASVFRAADALGLSGATQWEYSQSKDLWNSETNTVVEPDGTEYPMAQALIRPYARAVSGSSITQSWNDAKKTFTLSYAPGAGSTDLSEVRLPARAYPNGYKVTIQGGCYDATSAQGELLIQADAGAKSVTLSVTP